MNGIVGTAGHIDHGKTALIGALTGEETDRLPEERARGISIDLGFSHLYLPGGRLGIVDVPGHEDFIRNMLAGATGIDLLLLVVAADEGVMPQTREHTAIAELLGVSQAVVALTKVDRVDDDWLALVRDDVADFLAGTPYADAPVVPTSATSGEGLEELRAALERAFPARDDRTDDLFRLPVDRAFTVHGTGTVITGTVWSGRLERDAEVRLVPGGTTARVRGLQVHGRDVESIGAGERAAIALAGVDREEVRRGAAAVSSGAWEETHILTARLRLLADSSWLLEHGQRVRVHLGTAEVMARVALLEGSDPLLPGQEGWGQLRLERPLVARAGDRVVIRSYSPVTTIGGGIVVEPLAPRRARLGAGEAELLGTLLTADPGNAARALVEAAGEAGVETRSLGVRTRRAGPELDRALDDALRIGDRVYATGAAAALGRRLREAVEAHHHDHPLQPGIEPEALRRLATGSAAPLLEHALDRLLEEGALVRLAGRVAKPGWTPVLSDADAALRDRVAATLAAEGLAAPRLGELAEQLGSPPQLEEILALLERARRVVRLEHDLFVDGEALTDGIRRVQQRLGGRTGVNPGDFREVLGLSRKHLMPLLQHLDREGITVRTGDGRTVAAT